MRGVIKILRLSWKGCFILFCLALSIEAIGQSGNTVCQLTGKVTYRGNPVPDDCRVMASIPGVATKPEALVKNGVYSLLIPADDPSTSEKDGWEQGDYITLEVKGYGVTLPFEVKAGNFVKDINLTTMGVLNLTTWGKIKALFK
ncbi:MAG: hypothetical protein Q8O10_02555 [candidate division Zixibacteria bacterium]|nr:hypothetical protein [candidate division Zixibacteria bacterium]